jgi:hypothetical protein
VRFRRCAGVVAACILLAGCANPTASIKATEFSEEDTATYLILSDQFQRVRNVLKKPARVCAGRFPNGLYRGLEPVPGHVMDQLIDEQASAEIPLEIVSNFECLAHFVANKGPFKPEPTELLSFAGRYDGPCGDWIGGMYNQGNLNRGVQYNVEIEDGVARLTDGRGCGASLQWYRS